jgi:hypothetical protein
MVPAPRDRTWDLPLTGRLLCRLSYAGKKRVKKAAAPPPQRTEASLNSDPRKKKARRRWPNLDVHDVKQRSSLPQDGLQQ